MAKKSRRSRAQSRPTVNKTESRSIPVSSEVVNTAVRKVSTPLATNTSALAALQLQRKYVITELRRIGIIAGSLIIVLIVLTFVLG